MVDGAFSIPLGSTLRGSSRNSTRNHSTRRRSQQSLTSHAAGGHATGGHATGGIGAFAGDRQNATLALIASTVLEPTGRYLPTTLCGATGVGKTMLLRGFTANYRHRFPEAQTYCRSAVDFARGFADALDTNSLADFRRRTREVQFFALDDLHQIQQKKAAQEELCRTLDELAWNNSHGLLSIAAPWNQVRLILGLQSRMEGGLIAAVHPPNKSTRHRLILQCAEECQVRTTSALVDWLLDTVLTTGTTYREIRHCVHQVHQVARPGGEVNIEDVRPLLEPTSSQEVTIPSIQAAVARLFQCRKKDLVGASRQQGIMQARSVAMFLSRELTNLSFREIGSKFGKRDHSTVMHACRKTAKQLANDEAFATTIHQLRDTLCPVTEFDPPSDPQNNSDPNLPVDEFAGGEPVT